MQPDEARRDVRVVGEGERVERRSGEGLGMGPSRASGWYSIDTRDRNM
jgi:hypothetical protein